MVFGLALSLGAITLIGQPPQDPSQLYAALGIFAFSFIILMTVWYSYTTIMASITLETRGLLLLNLVLLFVVAIEPYLLAVVAFQPGPSSTGLAEPGSVLYAIDVAAMNAILGAFMHILARGEKPLLAPPQARKMRIRRDFTRGAAALFLVSALPVFWTWIWLGLPSRVVLWILTLPLGWVVRARTR